MIVPDGSSLKQAVGGVGETHWFVFGTEPGKTYVVEAVDTDDDTVVNDIGTLNVFAADGPPPPPAETSLDCAANARAPSLEVASDGKRCVVRTFPPSPGNTQNKRGLYVAVGGVTGASFQVRVRESTIYGRWTTNGYDFHVELQNTTADAMCAEIILLPNGGDTYAAGMWSGGIAVQTLTIPAFGANKAVFLNGTLGGGGQARHAADRRVQQSGEPDAERIEREHLCVQSGDQSISVLLHQRGEQRRDVQQLVIRHATTPASSRQGASIARALSLLQ